ncbi:hypothetical protein GCM10010967_27350 [Dyadobacter beijingensis]|uniref:CBM6 domain-containing protein n=1 Tax=Dyadobacter beijingensis TaxID=365489 RepID=A0ABQ2HVC4_9BACT|nr:hypothetical protein GCM10010967_27350 [Dyadobacter beijingensis]
MNYYTTYAAYVPTTARYQVKLRYYAERNSWVNVSVNNGQPVQVELPASHSWNIVAIEHTFELNLTKDLNFVTITELPGYDVRHDKACFTEIPGTEWEVTCDYQVNPRVVGNLPIFQPGQTVTLDAQCSGNDCGATSMAWFGDNFNMVGEEVSFPAPATPGDYTYRLVAFRSGCSNVIDVNVTIRVQTTPAECDYIVGSIVSDYTPSCGQGVSVSADCFGTGCPGLTYTWTGPGLNATGSTVNFYAPTQNGTYTYTRTSSKPGCADKTSDFQLTITDCSSGGTPFQACIESENAGGTGPITEDPNASGGKTRGERDRSDYTVSYTIPGVQVEGPHAVTFRYYAEANTAVNVQINDELTPYKIELPASGSWNVVWTERSIVFALKKGTNTIVVKGIPGYAPVRHDKICIVQMPGTTPSCDFNVTTSASTPNPACGSNFTMTGNCAGGDCGSVYYNWYGDNGFARYTQTIDVTAPSSNGTYTVSLVVGKDGCAQKIVPVSYQVTNCFGPGGETAACVEAEHSESNSPESPDPNASNGLTRGYQNNYDYYVDYKLNNFAASQYPVRLRYYAEQNARVSVSVNGTIVNPDVHLPATYSWNIVAREQTFWVTLAAGQNTIRIQGLPGVPVRQDKICVGDAQSNARMAAPEFTQAQTEPALFTFPNPAPGEFKAVFQLDAGKLATIRVTDVHGKVWHTQAVKGKGRHEERIRLSNAPSGIYLLQVKKPDSVETKKVLLTH